jgi:nucleotide-binding universal stress UspA family protein
MPCKILLPVDGSEGSLRATRHVAGIAAMAPGLHVHLLNVQPPGDDWMVRRMLKAEELDALETGWGESAIAPAREILSQAGVEYTARIVKGEVAQSIVQHANEQGCDQIVMGSHGRSALGGLLLGSVASRVLHLADIPVTLVK